LGGSQTRAAVMHHRAGRGSTTHTCALYFFSAARLFWYCRLNVLEVYDRLKMVSCSLLAAELPMVGLLLLHRRQCPCAL
jgi:hypothetical protein